MIANDCHFRGFLKYSNFEMKFFCQDLSLQIIFRAFLYPKFTKVNGILKNVT